MTVLSRGVIRQARKHIAIEGEIAPIAALADRLNRLQPALDGVHRGQYVSPFLDIFVQRFRDSRCDPAHTCMVMIG